MKGKTKLGHVGTYCLNMMTSEKEKKNKKTKRNSWEEIYHTRCKNSHEIFLIFWGKKNSKRALLYDHHAFNKSCHLLELRVIAFVFIFDKT
jgi:hypothetical protein